MNTKLFFPVVISIFIIACTETKADLKTEKAAILNADSTWSTLTAEGKDVDKILSYWAEDAVVVPPGQPVVRGKESLRKFVEESFKIPGFGISWRSSDVKLSPEGKLAYLYAENMTTINDSTGNKISIPGRGYTVWRKESDGSWKCVVDIFNNPSQ